MIDYRKIYKEALDTSGLEKQVLFNHQLFILLIRDARFERWVTVIRNEFHIPKTGFREFSKPLKRWYVGLDQDAWDQAILTSLVLFPRLTDNFLPAIQIYVKFNHVSDAPIFDFLITGRRINGQDRHWITLHLYAPPGDNWDFIKSRVDMLFGAKGIKKYESITDFELRMKTLRPKKLIEGTIGTNNENKISKENDRDLVYELFVGVDMDNVKRFANLVSQYRKRMNDIKRNRLG